MQIPSLRRFAGLPLIAALMAFISALFICCAPRGQAIRNFLYDQLASRRSDQSAPEVVLVLVDEQTMKTQRSDINRALYAKVIDQLRPARAIVLDIVFSEAFKGESDAQLKSAMQAYRTNGGTIILGSLEFKGELGSTETLAPQSDFRELAAGFGPINIDADNDGVVRLHRFGRSSRTPALAYAAGGVLGKSSHPPENEQRWINYYGGDPFTIKPMSEILNHPGPINEFAGKIVFIGMGAIAARSGQFSQPNRGRDEFRLPGSLPSDPAISGTQVQASIFANIRRGDWYWRWPASIELLMAVLLGAATGAAINLAPRQTRILVILAAGIICAAIVIVIWTRIGLILSIPFIALSQVPAVGGAAALLLWMQSKTVLSGNGAAWGGDDERTKGLVEACPACNSPDRIADVVFIHGLDGDSRRTWTYDSTRNGFWPAWLGEDLPKVGVWSVGYDISSTGWSRGSMPLADRAANILGLMGARDIGERPIIFIVHSFGGLVVKQALRTASDSYRKTSRRLLENTRGIVFLSTPHTGSDIATWVNHLPRIFRTTVTIEELRAHNSPLRELNKWFREHAPKLNIDVQIYFEKRPVGGLLVVDEDSADPGFGDALPMDDNHITICKPTSRDTLLYLRVKRFIEEHVPRSATSKSESVPMDALPVRE